MKNKSKRLIWVGAILGGLYSLVPFFVTLLIETRNPWELFGVLLPFYPSGLTFLVLAFFLGSILSLLRIGLNNDLSFVFLNLFNIALWIIIGAGISKKLLSNKKGKNR